jgi:hypothetical protein
MTYREQTLRDLGMELELAKQDLSDAVFKKSAREANEKIDFIQGKIDFLSTLRYGLFTDEEMPK